MIEAALFPNDRALLCEQVVHDKVLRRVVDDFFIIECEGHWPLDLLWVGAKDALEVEFAADVWAFLQADDLLGKGMRTLLWFRTNRSMFRQEIVFIDLEFYYLNIKEPRLWELSIGKNNYQTFLYVLIKFSYYSLVVVVLSEFLLKNAAIDLVKVLIIDSFLWVWVYASLTFSSLYSSAISQDFKAFYRCFLLCIDCMSLSFSNSFSYLARWFRHSRWVFICFVQDLTSSFVPLSLTTNLS